MKRKGSLKIPVLITAAVFAFAFLFSGAQPGGDTGPGSTTPATPTEPVTNPPESQYGNTPFFFPPSTSVEFTSVSAKWLGGTATPAIRLSVKAKAGWNDNIFSPLSVVGISADISTNNGLIWKTYKLSPSDTATGAWEATIELPEWSKPAEIPDNPAASGASGSAGIATSGETVPAATGAAGTPSGYERGLQKGQAVNITGSKAAKPPANSASPEMIGGATATICLIAVDSQGNTTAELPSQAVPQFEKDVHFTRIITDPQETLGIEKPDYVKSPDRDIVEVSVAWLREKLFLRARIAGTTIPGKVIEPGINYYIPRFIPFDTHPLAVRAGQGIFHYFLANPAAIDWPRKSPFGDVSFMLMVNEEYLIKLTEIMKLPDKELSAELKQFKKDLLGGKIDLTSDIYTKIPYEDSGLTALALADRLFWRIDREKLVSGSKYPEGIRITMFTGYIDRPDDYSLHIDDVTRYATVYFRRRILAAGETELKIDYSESEAPPGVLLPPGAVGELRDDYIPPAGGGQR